MTNCKYCGKETSNKVYCSRECQAKGLSIENRSAERIKRECEFCGEEFKIKKNDLKFGKGKYCSRICKDKHQKVKYKGENNPSYNRNVSEEEKEKRSKTVKESWKNDEIREKRLKSMKDTLNKYNNEYGYSYGWSDEARKKRKKTLLENHGVEHIWEGEYGNRDCDNSFIEEYGITSIEYAQNFLDKASQTKIEKIVENILNNNDIKYKKEKRIYFDDSYKKYDFYLKNYNILIECDGDYWHGNPKFFESFNKTQRSNKKNDKFKNKLAKEKGFNLLRYWEDEIKKKNFNKKLIGDLNEFRED